MKCRLLLTAVFGALAFAGCGGGGGLVALPAAPLPPAIVAHKPVTPAASPKAASSTPVAVGYATAYTVTMHPSDASTLAMLQTIRNVWHAGGVRMDYDAQLPKAFYDDLTANARAVGLALEKGARSGLGFHKRAAHSVVRNRRVAEEVRQLNTLHSTDILAVLGEFVESTGRTVREWWAA